jgi:uncharacterized membrane protein YfcA
MGEFACFALIGAAMFFGAVVSGTIGFGFSAIAGAIVLHVMPPIEAVPLLMICSLPVQISSLAALIRGIAWQRCFIFVAGGLIGVAPAVYLLRHLDTERLRAGFGILIAVYAGYMLLRSMRRVAAAPRAYTACALGDGLVGFGGGLLGGLAAMPAALPSIWCDLHGLPKGTQRGIVQPYILIVQIAALMLLTPHIGWSSDMLVQLAISLPALAAGTLVGIMLFGRINDTLFRRIVLGTLLVSGVVLAA